MTVKITFKAERDIILPFSNKHVIQAVLYSIAGKAAGDFLHDGGYSYEKRKYKLFTFSDILESPLHSDKKNKQLRYGSSISVLVSAAGDMFIKGLSDAFIAARRVNICGTEARISALERIETAAGTDVRVKAVSPVTMYTTFTEPRKRTYFYRPDEPEFSQLIRENLLKKYRAYYGTEPENTAFEIVPAGKLKEIYTSYKGFIIVGYKGRFRLRGSAELISLAFDAGIGGKSSQGHGMIVPESVWV